MMRSVSMFSSASTAVREWRRGLGFRQVSSDRQPWLLPLPAGGGWEGVKLLRQERPHPNPPLLAGEGAQRKASCSCRHLHQVLAWIGDAPGDRRRGGRGRAGQHGARALALAAF